MCVLFIIQNASYIGVITQKKNIISRTKKNHVIKGQVPLKSVVFVCVCLSRKKFDVLELGKWLNLKVRPPLLHHIHTVSCC